MSISGLAKKESTPPREDAKFVVDGKIDGKKGVDEGVEPSLIEGTFDEGVDASFTEDRFDKSMEASCTES